MRMEFGGRARRMVDQRASTLEAKHFEEHHEALMRYAL